MKLAGTFPRLPRALLGLVALAAAVLGPVGTAQAQEASNKLEAVDVQTLPGQQLQDEPVQPGRSEQALAKTTVSAVRGRVDHRPAGRQGQEGLPPCR